MGRLLIALGIILLLLVLFVGLMTHVVADSREGLYSWQRAGLTNQEARRARIGEEALQMTLARAWK